MVFIYLDEDNVIEWSNMTDGTDSSFVNDATVTFDVKDLADVSKGAGSMAYVAGSDGKYQGVFTSTDAATLIAGTSYAVEITAASSGRDGFRRLPVVARYHQ